MFGKSKDDNDQLPSPVQQPERPAVAKSAEQGSADQVSTISRGMTIVGKISGEGTLNVFGQVEGELRALNVLINEGARVEGDVVAQELTIGWTGQGCDPCNARQAEQYSPGRRRHFPSLALDRRKCPLRRIVETRGQCRRYGAHPHQASGRPR